ncbi:MAG TPA: TIGR00303 family protein [Campylobacterales bacterium]|nr:TIGR00303 family protein [Campylobacterales bacterium]
MVKQFHGNNHFLENIQNKKATFLLAGAVTQTCEIEGITQAGIPGLIHLTPTLDAEFVDSGKLFSLDVMAETPKGVPTPAIITRAVKLLSGFDFESVDLGLRVKPQVETLHHQDIQESKSIQIGADIDAKSIIQKGQAFAASYTHPNELLILGESTPSGTTTAYAVAKALGYKSEGHFSSSFLDAPQSLKERVVADALSLAQDKDIYEKLGLVSDNMLLFCAGFVSSFSHKSPIILGGGTQMAAVLLIIDTLDLEINTNNVALMTTRWVYEDPNSDIKGLMAQTKFQIDGYFAEFTFANTLIPILKSYDKGEAKEGVGAGAALCYAFIQGFSQEQILKEIEKVLTA